MCLGIPGEVVSRHPEIDDLVTVDVLGARRLVNVGLLDERPAPGQWVLIHVGFALEVIDADGARAALAGLELLGRPDPLRPPDPTFQQPDQSKEAAPWAP